MAFDGGHVWEPQPGPQTDFVTCPHDEVIYGGARGGGKTDATIGEFAMHAAEFGREAFGLLVRRSRTALEPTIDRAKQIYGPLGATWHEQKSRFVFPSGAILSCQYLDRDADADRYQGHSYTRVYVEELTQFVSPRPVDKLKATLRSAAGVPTGFRATCNPGGPGHTWVKRRYIDPGAGVVVEHDGLTCVFIPARIADNPKLALNDPFYVARLRQSGSEALVKAWLDGNWDIIEGAFFDKWGRHNVVRPFAIPGLWTMFASFDWGFAAPFSVGWWAVASDNTPCEGGIIPRGALVRYREWYGSNGKPNEGLRLDAEAVAQGIVEREKGEILAYRVADPSIFAQTSGPAISERMLRAGVRFRPADNTRVGKLGALSGWDQVRARIGNGDEPPMLFVFDTCRDFIRTVPALQHDPARPEDLDTDGEDHVADETRYACLSRPMTAKHPHPVTDPSDRGQWGAPGAHRRQERDGWKVV